MDDKFFFFQTNLAVCNATLARFEDTKTAEAMRLTPDYRGEVGLNPCNILYGALELAGE